jgi:hypothetical protein
MGLPFACAGTAITGWLRRFQIVHALGVLCHRFFYLSKSLIAIKMQSN